jgi:hypothetical protein
MSARTTTPAARNRHDRVVERAPLGPIVAHHDRAGRLDIQPGPAVKAQLAQLEENVTDLIDAVDTITKSLEPVLRPEPPATGGGGGGENLGESVVGEVAARVRQSSRNVIGLSTRLRDLVNRLEV